MEEDFVVKDLFDCIGWTPFLDRFSSWHYGSYALLWGTTRQDEVNIEEPSMEKKVITSPKTLVATSGYPKERLVFDKDREKDIA